MRNISKESWFKFTDTNILFSGRSGYSPADVTAHRAGVGPMAAVAGAISEFVERTVKFFVEVIVENGGDIFIQVKATGLQAYMREFSLSQKIGLTGRGYPMGICTSSGKIGHSLSFGKADAVVILSRDTAL